MRIGRIAARAGVSAGTIRFWEDQRLLPEPARTTSGYREYEPEVVDRLVFIGRAKAAGFTLDQIRQVLDVGDTGQPACEHVGQLIDARLAEVEARIAELEATRAHLRALARRAAAQDPASCEGYCAIIVAPGAVGASPVSHTPNAARNQSSQAELRPVTRHESLSRGAN
jgi:DNA-binding transcriptional MerR regulator